MELRYLAYIPWPAGLNNARLSFESAAAMAYLTGRILVVQENLHRGGDEAEGINGEYRPLHPRTYLAPPMRTISSDAVPLDLLTFQLPFYEPDTYVIALEDGDDLEAFAAGRRVVTLSEEAHAAPILKLPRQLDPFYALIYARQQTRHYVRRFVRDHVRYPAPLQQMAEAMAISHAPYHALSVRRGDFITVRPHLAIPADDLVKVVEQRARRGDRLVIATDEQDREFFRPLMRLYDVRFAGDIVAVAAPPQWTRWWRDCAEQVICALGVTFAGTYLSTYSSYINRLRGYYGVLDKDIRFTGGYSHTESLREYEELARHFSWQAARDNGVPVWGREFWEGWQV